MQPEITEKLRWIQVEGTHGTHYFPCLYFSMGEARENYPGEIETVEECSGYGARLSMPSYLDCTEWTVFDKKSDAAKHLLAVYFDYPDDELTEVDKGWREILVEIEAGLPQPWVDFMIELGADPRGQMVWLYDDESPVFGRPYPLTDAARIMILLYNHVEGTNFSIEAGDA